MVTKRRAAAYAAAAAAATADGPFGFAQRMASIPRLARDVMIGRYHGLSRSRLLLMALAVVYVVSPVDLFPEALLTIPGLVDDVAVAGWLVAATVHATTAYRAWEHAGPAASADPRVVPGQVISG